MSSITMEQPTHLAEAADTSYPADEYIIAQPGAPIVNITAFTARQKASGYVGDQISHLMGGDAPTFTSTGLLSVAWISSTSRRSKQSDGLSKNTT